MSGKLCIEIMPLRKGNSIYFEPDIRPIFNKDGMALIAIAQKSATLWSLERLGSLWQIELKFAFLKVYGESNR